MNVADLKLAQPDSLGIDNVSYFYARKPPEYAVYRTEDSAGRAQRVLVHFADDTVKSDDQRKALAQLAPARGEIAGLVDGWRSAPDHQCFPRSFWVSHGLMLRKKAEHYDRRVGDALTVAMEGDLTGAGEVLRKIKLDISEERIGRSRFEYLLTALSFAIVFILLAGVSAWMASETSCDERVSALCFRNGTDLWRGAMGGACGSFFSIVLAIRGRTILTDLNRTTNLIDAALRVVIGVIAGVVLVALILEEFVRISFGHDTPNHWSSLYFAIAGFLAGFAERLVPDLLAKAEVRTGEAPVLRRAESESAAKPKADAAAAQNEGDPRPGPANAPSSADPQSDHHSDPQPDQAHEDGCVAEITLQENEITPDEGLPAASGGVAQTGERGAA